MSGICQSHCRGAEWQLDTKFSAAEELLRDPEFKTVVKAALEKGAELVIQKQRGAG